MNQRIPAGKWLFLFIALFIFSASSFAQGDASVTARMDSRQILVGDPARLFIEVRHNPAVSKVQWPILADTFNHLEITEKGKIDTVKEGGNTLYRQRLLITGFDSGVFKIPAFQFAVTPSSGTPYVLQTDSFALLVQTVPVDTTKEFKPIKNIILVQPNWWEKYLWALVVFFGLIFLVILFVVLYVRKKPVAIKPKAPEVPLQDRVLKQLAELEAQQLWQKGQTKEYYVQLTDIVRNYIEARFSTSAMELTTDDLLFKVQHHRDLQPYYNMLSAILHTADLAKFAKGQPLPQEHFDAMEHAKQFVATSRPQPAFSETQTEQKQ
jgi:hypothetical protein